MRVELLVLFGLACCASSGGALAQRDELRKRRVELEQAPIDPSYRSINVVRGVRWGMTPDEVIAIKGEPARRAKDSLFWSEELDASAVPSTYEFFDGHLAQLESRFEAGRDQGRRLEQALTLKYGAPTAVFDKTQANLQALDKARDQEIALMFFGWRGWDGASLTAARIAAENAAKPARDVSWSAPEVQVHLVTLDGGLTLVAWTSRKLGPKLMQRQLSAAGLQNLADEL
jgi:hypothetical protein